MFSYLIIVTAFLHVCAGYPDSRLECPCPSLDRRCIFKYFTEHADCRTPMSRPRTGLLVKHSEIYIPFLNCTVLRENIRAPGALAAKITAFLVDKADNLTIMTITYTNLVVTIDKASVIYYRTAKPPIYTSVNSTSLLERLDLTVYFNGVSHIDLNDSFTFAAISGDKSNIRTNPSIESYQGTEFELLFRLLKTDYNVYVQELEAPPYAKAFSTFWIQNNVCNFGVNIE